jgi:hypothetical protein
MWIKELKVDFVKLRRAGDLTQQQAELRLMDFWD